MTLVTDFVKKNFYSYEFKIMRTNALKFYVQKELKKWAYLIMH